MTISPRDAVGTASFSFSRRASMVRCPARLAKVCFTLCIILPPLEAMLIRKFIQGRRPLKRAKPKSSNSRIQAQSAYSSQSSHPDLQTGIITSSMLRSMTHIYILGDLYLPTSSLPPAIQNHLTEVLIHIRQLSGRDMSNRIITRFVVFSIPLTTYCIDLAKPIQNIHDAWLEFVDNELASWNLAGLLPLRTRMAS